MHGYPGTFVVFEGGEGTGKSTQIKRFSGELFNRHIPHVVTREPGGTPIAEAIRETMLRDDIGTWLSYSELLMIMAARRDHVFKVIMPALADGKWVLCDRFSDSTRVYQGFVHEISLDFIDELQMRISTIEPDLTILLDADPLVCLARKNESSDKNRYDNKGIDFHEKVREGFLAMVRSYETHAVIDAELDEEAVAREVMRALTDRSKLF